MRAKLASIVALAAAAALGCKEEHHHGGAAPVPAIGSASPDRVPPGVNAVQNEMRLLVEAMRTSVTAIGYGTLDAIPESLHSVHRARELTEKALESGEYKLSKNADKRATFEELDEQFHRELESLVTAASAKDAAKTGAQLGAVMSKCSGCHDQFKP